MPKILHYTMNSIFYVALFSDYNSDGKIVFIIKFGVMFTFPKDQNDLYFMENVNNYFFTQKYIYLQRVTLQSY